MRICAVYKHTPRPESRPRALPSGPGTTGGTREQGCIPHIQLPNFPLSAVGCIFWAARRKLFRVSVRVSRTFVWIHTQGQ